MSQVNYAELVQRLSESGESFGLLTMQATSTTKRLMASVPDRLKCFFSAEHGFFGAAAPGEKTTSAWHPYWNRPIHSLYGEHRRPTDEMLEGLDRVVIDLCDIGVRCYTYLSTLRNMMIACAERGIAVTVLDRQVPLGGVVDGPMRLDEFSSFVAAINVPLCHGMTPGECAMWIREHEAPSLKLDVVRLLDWSHEDRAPWPNFIPPSPSIRSWDSAVAYSMTVFTEAYGAIDCDRSGPLAFRIVGAPWIEQVRTMAELTPTLERFGVEMRPYRYQAADGANKGLRLDGILFSVADVAAFRPVRAGLSVLALLRDRYGDKPFVGGRHEWMDKLMGTEEVRESLMNGTLGELFAKWDVERREYIERKANLYA